MGTNFRTRDGTAIRDFVHVTDLVDAHIAVVGRNPRTRDPLTLRP
jgi:UDP-glucose 4-epimerase